MRWNKITLATGRLAKPCKIEVQPETQQRAHTADNDVEFTS